MPDVQLLGLRGRAEVMTGVDRRAPGRGEVFPFRTGALPIADEELATVEAEAFLALGRRVGVQIAPRLRGSDAELPRVDLVVGAGSWTLAAGRQPVGFGKARPGGMVLGGTASIDRIEVKSGRPTTVEQGPLHLLGPVALELFAGRIRDDRHAREPYMWGGSFSIQPFPRLGLAVQRAAMFGGKGWDEPVTLKTVVDMLIGRVANLGFENQIVSVEARYRLPTEGTLPLTAYLEWGAEDAAGGWWDVPGRQFGLESPSIPGMEALSVGAAFTDIAPSCCGNPPWYRHGAFNGNWALDDRPLGHPLGGEGKEWLMYGGFDEGATVRVDARLFRRHREGQNLFVPGRMWSTGGAIQAQWRPRPRLDVDLEVQVESGSDWSEHELRAGLNLFF